MFFYTCNICVFHWQFRFEQILIYFQGKDCNVGHFWCYQSQHPVSIHHKKNLLILPFEHLCYKEFLCVTWLHNTSPPSFFPSSFHVSNKATQYLVMVSICCDSYYIPCNSFTSLLPLNLHNTCTSNDCYSWLFLFSLCHPTSILNRESFFLYVFP